MSQQYPPNEPTPSKPGPGYLPPQGSSPVPGQAFPPQGSSQPPYPPQGGAQPPQPPYPSAYPAPGVGAPGVPSGLLPQPPSRKTSWWKSKPFIGIGAGLLGLIVGVGVGGAGGGSAGVAPTVTVTSRATVTQQAPAASGATTKPAASPAQKQAAQGTRDHPYPLGTKIAGTNWEVVVNSVTIDGTQAVRAANEFNDPPTAGSQYAVVNYTVTYTGKDANGAIPLEVGIAFVTADGVTVNSYDSFVIAPDPAFNSATTLYTGATATGNVVFQVPSATAANGVLSVRPGFIADKVFVAVQ